MPLFSIYHGKRALGKIETQKCSWVNTLSCFLGYVILCDHFFPTPFLEGRTAKTLKPPNCKIITAMVQRNETMSQHHVSSQARSHGARAPSPEIFQFTGASSPPHPHTAFCHGWPQPPPNQNPGYVPISSAACLTWRQTSMHRKCVQQAP